MALEVGRAELQQQESWKPEGSTKQNIRIWLLIEEGVDDKGGVGVRLRLVSRHFSVFSRPERSSLLLSLRASSQTYSTRL